MSETMQQKRKTPGKKWAVGFAALTGFIFPITAILIIILHSGRLFTIKNISIVHSEHPELYVFYFLPLIAACVTNFLYKRQQKDEAYFKEIISKKSEKINRYAQIAGEIGKGNYNVQIIPDNERDLLGDSLLVMKENLLSNYRKEKTYRWISDGKHAISDILRRYDNLEEMGDQILEHLVKYIDAIQGAIYLFSKEENALVSFSTYAYQQKKNTNQRFTLGFGLIGQCAYDRDYILRTEIPDDYFTISSGLLGEQKPASLLIVPLIADDLLQGVIEVAFLSPDIPEQTIDLMKELADMIARTILNLSRFQEKENIQNKYHLLLENTSEVIALYDKDLKSTYVSPSVKPLLGCSPKEYLNGADFDGLAPEDQKKMKDLLSLILESPSKSKIFQYKYVRKDGRQIMLESKFRNMLEDPYIKGIVLITKDIAK